MGNITVSRGSHRGVTTPMRALTFLAVVSGLLLSSAPALAAPDGLTIASIDVSVPPAPKTGAVKGRVNVVASDGDTLRYAAARPARGTVSISPTGAFTYTPTATARHRAAKDGARPADRRDTVQVVVTNSSGHRASRSVRVPILGANKAPVVSLALGTPDPTTGVVRGTLIATDPDGDPLTYRLASNTTSVSRSGMRQLRATDPQGDSIVCPSSSGSLSVNAGTGAFTYVPNSPPPSSGVSSTDNFTVTVSDGYGGSTSTPVAVPVTAPNPSTGVVTGNV